MYFIIAAIVWYLLGLASFIFWWTTEYDLTVDGLPVALIAAIGGPISFIIGWTVHGGSTYNKILVKKRRG